ncbi:MAG: N-acetyl-gamma-glutamyl-phosphate reductase [Thermodesulfobacteriota bacterium]
MTIKVGILGATGYTGAELLRLLVSHPEVEISWLTSEKFAGQRIDEVFPNLVGFCDLRCESISKLGELPSIDLAFSCLPHGTSMHFVGILVDNDIRVVDFSADFRFRRADNYTRWYGREHERPDLVSEAAYGLTELYRKNITKARLVANPGCFATGAVLGVAPLSTEGLLSGTSIVVDAKGGMSGVGRAPVLEAHFVEANEAISAGPLEGHGQKGEIEQELRNIAVEPSKAVFIPHTVPVSRGIFTTIYADFPRRLYIPEVLEYYREFYRGERFIRLCPEGTVPDVKNTRYSNFIDIGIGIQDGKVVICIALDNLGKGASGQAVQNMNVMFGFDEGEGLKHGGMFP